jgi:hypothetical protein
VHDHLAVDHVAERHAALDGARDDHAGSGSSRSSSSSSHRHYQYHYRPQLSQQESDACTPAVDVWSLGCTVIGSIFVALLRVDVIVILFASPR